MQLYEVAVDRVLDVELRDEFIDRLNYVSKDIVSIEFIEEPKVIFTLEKGTEEEKDKIKRMTDRFYKSYKFFKNKVLYDHNIEVPNKKDVWDELVSSKAVVKEENGVVGISGVCLELLSYFSDQIKKMGEELGAVEYKYPTLIPIKTMQNIMYLSSRPESLNFVSRLNEDMNLIDDFSEQAKTIESDVDMSRLGSHFQTDMINSSAVCFHTYAQYKNRDLNLTDKPLIIGAEVKCFRYESKSMRTLERLRDFTMREIICLGTEEMISEYIKNVTEKIKLLFEEIGMNYYLASANDPFFVEEFSIQSTFQRTFGLKTEVNARLNGNSSKVAIGSINNHKDFLGRSFHITNNGKVINSSCAAFGLERCVYAFLNQYGLDKKTLAPNCT